MFHTPAQSKMVGSKESGIEQREKHRDLSKMANKVLREMSTSEQKETPATSTKFKSPAASSTHGRSKGQTSTSSVKTRRAQLKLEAAQKKAQIQMELIDRQLEADLADLHENGSKYSPTIEDLRTKQEVEQWLERSRDEVQSAPDHVFSTGELQPAMATATNTVAPAAPAAPHGIQISLQPPAPAPPHLPTSQPPAPPTYPPGASETVQMLASAVKNLSAMSTPSNNILTRLCMPKDLPEFYGDPLEWLHFKQAYDESTEVCHFSPKENLWRLRKCLRGAAKDAVAALLISASTPCKVMSTLELRFGNPEYIISRIMQDIKKLHPMSQDYHKDVVQFSVKVQNLLEAVRAVGHEEYLQGMSIVSVILSKFPPILLSKWSDYSYQLIIKRQKSRIEILSDFLYDEAVKISATSNIYFNNPRTDQNKYRNNDNSNRTQTILLQSNDDDTRICQFCRTSKHKLTDCKQFKKALRKTRWQYAKRNGICYKCLVARHPRDVCTAPACDKDGCSGSHHRLLHFDVNKAHDNAPSQHLVPTAMPTPTPTISMTMPAGPACEPVNSKQTVTHINASESTVLLKVVPIRIHTYSGIVSTNALLDDGSTVSLLSAGLARRAGINGCPETMRIRGAWADKELVCESIVANVNISGIDNKMHNIKLRCVDKLDLPVQHCSIVNCDKYANLLDIKSVLCTSDVKPEILIGQDNFHLLLPLEVRLGNINEPSATLTPLGWCLHGTIRAERGPRAHATMFLSSVCADAIASTAAAEEVSLLRDLHEEVRRSFALDSIGVSGKPRQNTYDVCAVARLEETAELVERRWRVGLPWRSDVGAMPDAYPNAERRLKGIERKMSRDRGFDSRYRERIEHLLDNNYAEKLTDIHPASRTWYLPHFGVDNPNKKKLRLVFDAADEVNGKSLNHYLHTGPDLLPPLFGIMLRFRENLIAVTGDIKDMFLRVKIRAEDQHAFRFLWRSSPTAPVDTYMMSSLIFGANCSPFVAQFVKNLNARRYESSLPAAVNAIYKSHYVDDYIDSLPDEATAIEIVKNISHIHKSGGFEMRNWTSNSVAVLDSVPKETLGSAAVKFKVGQEYLGERTLGLIWYPGEDRLGFDLSLKRIPENIIQGRERPTKRVMLQVVMSIFDVIGFLSPFSIQGKIMLQDTWRLNVGWDDVIPDCVNDKWRKWIDLLKDLNCVRIPRYYHSASKNARESETAGVRGGVAAEMCATMSGYETERPSTSTTTLRTPIASTNTYVDLQLHTFSDASVKAMCTVAYWRWLESGEVHVAFIASKCRVVPVKPLTVPRAELQAAVLAARLADTILKEHRMVPERRFFWSDSTTVLQWIRNNTRSYKTFEANRLGEIDELTLVAEWKYVPTKLNMADLGTREEFDQALFEGEWFTGPKFLYEDELSWPVDVINPGENEVAPECVAVVQSTAHSILVPEPQRFSCWLRLLRATAVMLTFIDRCKGLTCEVDCDAMARAETLLLRKAQGDSFPDEISAIKNKKYISRESKLLTLSPYIDEEGLLRLGGRIDAAMNVDLEVKRPIILDGKHSITRLIIRYLHIKAAHGNQEMVVNNLKQKYWVIRMRPTVKQVVSSCMLCRIRKCKPEVPRMGDLPHARVAHHQRPFSFCGLDLFGPIEVTVGRSRQKRWGVIFTCLTVRCIFIDIVHSLTTDSLIMALRRMASRRGWPRHLYSDNGTNLRGADKELQIAMQGLDMDTLKALGANNGMKWHFVPPFTPHWAGAWERLIRSVKSTLRVVLKERAPREEVLSTFMAEVENMVNSRPLTHVSVDHESSESLTPNHFLLGSSGNMPLIGTFDDSDMYLRKQWRKAQRLADMYWQRWVKEVLPDLLPRRKWNEEVKPLQVGDLVFIVDPESPRNTWPRGIVLRTHPGKDGRVRLVEVKTRTGVWKRSAARVARISIDE